MVCDPGGARVGEAVMIGGDYDSPSYDEDDPEAEEEAERMFDRAARKAWARQDRGAAERDALRQGVKQRVLLMAKHYAVRMARAEDDAAMRRGLEQARVA